MELSEAPYTSPFAENTQQLFVSNVLREDDPKCGVAILEQIAVARKHDMFQHRALFRRLLIWL